MNCLTPPTKCVGKKMTSEKNATGTVRYTHDNSFFLISIFYFKPYPIPKMRRSLAHVVSKTMERIEVKHVDPQIIPGGK